MIIRPIKSTEAANKSSVEFKGFHYELILSWLVPSKLPENRLEERLPGNNLPPRLPGSLPLLLEEWRSPIVIALELLLFGRLDVIRSRLNCSFASFPSSDWSVKSLKISRLTWDSNRPLLWLFRRHLRRTWLVSLRTPISAPFTPRGWPSCPRISSLLVVSAENAVNSSTFSTVFFKALTWLILQFKLFCHVFLMCEIQFSFWKK